MLRITNKQIEILANSIYEENFLPLIQKENTEFDKQGKALKLTKEEERVCKDLEKATNTYYNLKGDKSHYSRREYKELCDDLLWSKRRELKKTQVSKYPDKNKLVNDLTLKLVDASTLSDLVNSIKTKYKLK